VNERLNEARARSRTRPVLPPSSRSSGPRAPLIVMVSPWMATSIASGFQPGSDTVSA
jgi:hypothetical protein